MVITDEIIHASLLYVPNSPTKPHNLLHIGFFIVIIELLKLKYLFLILEVWYADKIF